MQDRYYFLYINDLHIDDFYQPRADFNSLCRNGSVRTSNFTYGQYKCDAPMTIFDSFIQHAPDLIDSIEFIVLAGDVDSHGDLLNRVQKRDKLCKVIQKLAKTFQKPILFSIGNSDFEKDYGSFEEDSFDFGNISTCLNLTEDQRKTFNLGGYYSYEPKGTDIRFLVLNTVMYSQVRNETKNDPYNQFEWISKMSGKNNYVFYHISPTLQNVSVKGMLWKESYIDNFQKIAKDIKLFFGAHSHFDQLLKTINSYSLLSPAMSPIHQNNPGFRVYEYNKKEVLDYTQYTADLSINPTDLQWKKEYSFSDEYDKKLNDIKSAVQKIFSSNDHYSSYSNRLLARTPSNYGFDFCVLNYTSKNEVNACMEQYQPCFLELP